MRSGAALHALGVTVSPGWARGRVRVLRSLDEVRDARPGDVLVAAAVPAAWAALLREPAAVVAEQGAATVLRERRIPAVFGVAGALDGFRDGDAVVDATCGVVHRLAPAVNGAVAAR